MLNPIKPSKLNLSKEFENQLNEFLSQGNEVKDLGNSMRSDALPYVINPNKGFDGKKLPPFHKRK